MGCEVFTNSLERNFEIMLTPGEKVKFCVWLSMQVSRGALTFESLVNDSPESVSGKLKDLEHLREEEQNAIRSAFQVLIDAYVASN
jgi:hypothetical protein